jgi:hypothetical protein
VPGKEIREKQRKWKGGEVNDRITVSIACMRLSRSAGEQGLTME